MLPVNKSQVLNVATVEEQSSQTECLLLETRYRFQEPSIISSGEDGCGSTVPQVATRRSQRKKSRLQSILLEAEEDEKAVQLAEREQLCAMEMEKPRSRKQKKRKRNEEEIAEEKIATGLGQDSSVGEANLTGDVENPFRLEPQSIDSGIQVIALVSATQPTKAMQKRRSSNSKKTQRSRIKKAKQSKVDTPPQQTEEEQDQPTIKRGSFLDPQAWREAGVEYRSFLKSEKKCRRYLDLELKPGMVVKVVHSCLHSEVGLPFNVADVCNLCPHSQLRAWIILGLCWSQRKSKSFLSFRCHRKYSVRSCIGEYKFNIMMWKLECCRDGGITTPTMSNKKARRLLGYILTILCLLPLWQDYSA